MTQQKQWLVQDPAMDEQLRCKPLAQSYAKLQKEETKGELTKQPIFRIETNFIHLTYNLADPSYRVHSQLLNHTKIKAQDRQKLKSWLLSETKNLYQRQTYAMASRYLDMFFSKQHKVPRNSFQALGIACLMLASKVVERRMPSISFQVFDKNQIFAFQKGLFDIFRYKVTPVTYVTLTELLLYCWDNYECQNNAFKNVKYFNEELKAIKRARTIFETLDCMDLVPQTLDIPLDQLVISVFFIQHRKFCLEEFKNVPKDADISTIQTNQNQQFNNLYGKFMQQFLMCLKIQMPVFSNFEINEKVILYTMVFSRINPKIYLQAKYKNFRFEVSRQTYNSEITQIAQNFINKC